MLNRDLAISFVAKYEHTITDKQKQEIFSRLKDGESVWKYGAFQKGAKELSINNIEGTKLSIVNIKTVGEDDFVRVFPDGSIFEIKSPKNNSLEK